MHIDTIVIWGKLFLQLLWICLLGLHKRIIPIITSAIEIRFAMEIDSERSSTEKIMLKIDVDEYTNVLLKPPIIYRKPSGFRQVSVKSLPKLTNECRKTYCLQYSHEVMADFFPKKRNLVINNRHL